VAWKANKRLVKEGFPDLEYLPRERTGWNATLTSLAFAVRRDIGRAPPDLGAWAARHGVAPSGRWAAVGPDALVLWHGTSRERADKIREHGLFHKKGLWTTLDPRVAHGYCRGRSERFATEGAMVCIVLDPGEVAEGQHYDTESKGDILRFHQGLPPDVVEYVLVADEIRFTGPRRARRPTPWPKGRFKRRGGEWVPVSRPPVRYSDEASYATLEEFVGLTMDRLLEELGAAAAIEVFSMLYALVEPWDALEHDVVFDLLEERCIPDVRRAKWRTFRARGL
jgi:hypothetical protein